MRNLPRFEEPGAKLALHKTSPAKQGAARPAGRTAAAAMTSAVVAGVAVAAASAVVRSRTQPASRGTTRRRGGGSRESSPHARETSCAASTPPPCERSASRALRRGSSEERARRSPRQAADRRRRGCSMRGRQCERPRQSRFTYWRAIKSRSAAKRHRSAKRQALAERRFVHASAPATSPIPPGWERGIAFGNGRRCRRSCNEARIESMYARSGKPLGIAAQGAMRRTMPRLAFVATAARVAATAARIRAPTPCSDVRVDDGADDHGTGQEVRIGQVIEVGASDRRCRASPRSPPRCRRAWHSRRAVRGGELSSRRRAGSS